MSSVRLDRLQRGLMATFAGLADVVSWEYTKAERGAGSLLTLGLDTDPEPHLQSHAAATAVLPADSAIVEVTAATEGARPVVRLNGFDYYLDVPASSSVTTVRDALLADIAAGEAGAVTPTATGADRITLTGDFLGGLRSLACSGPVQYVAESAVYSGAAVLIRTGTRVCEIAVEVFSRGRSPRTGAATIMQGVLDRLQSGARMSELGRYGVKRWGIGTPIKLDAIAGSDWETRRRLPFTAAVQSVHVEPVDHVESATLTIAEAS